MFDFLRRFFGGKSGYHGDYPSRRRTNIYAPLRSVHLDLTTASRKQLQEKAREFERKSSLFNRLSDLFELYTVGQGLNVYPISSDVEWNTEAKRLFEQWAKFPDLSSRQPWPILQSLVSRSWFVDGEVFAIKTQGDSGRRRLQLVECHRCSTPPDKAKDEGITIFDGVEVDQNGRPVRYWFSKDSQGSTEWEPIDSLYVLHVYEPSRPGQYRGIPFCHPAVNDLIDLDDLQELQMGAAKDAAEIGNVIYNESGEVSAKNLLRRRFTQTDTNSAGDTTSEQRADYLRKALPGRTTVLKVGEKLDQHRSERPSIVDMKFWDKLEERICAGVGIPRVLVFPDSMQGTVYRGALDCANAFFNARSSVMQWFVREVYIWITDYHSRTERSLADKPFDWAEVSIAAPRSVNVDVGRNSSAMLSELEAGATNYERIYAPEGLDWKAELRKKAEQAKFIREIAVEYDIDPSEISTKQIDRPERIQTSKESEDDPVPEPTPL